MVPCFVHFLVTGTRADEEVTFFYLYTERIMITSYTSHLLASLSPQTIDQLIETGDSEQIFQKAIREQGRGQVW